ncbi:hypothetical protein [Aliarcobacter butzleri]|uniref:hypothetical protein n=1 Tax=Aliarcobacter butzleri TaxID=28197 RepID=UPI0021B30835|nr:hypothetical protein [Aliarcobacter butzleri]MCT7563137.1 hypothetical protein [Aliarcobacter butzleri]MCT7578612.1 hypothetical protein [Aliarcobacter butzleri]
MVLVKRVAQLYDRCSSIEIKDFSQNIIKVKSIDSFIMSEVRFDSEEELNIAVASVILKIYLTDEVIITNDLVSLFENDMQLGKNKVSYPQLLIMYSDLIVKKLVENGYKKGLSKEALEFFYNK